MRIFYLLTLSLALISTSIMLAVDTRAQNLPFPANSTFFTGQPPSLNSAYSPPAGNNPVSINLGVGRFQIDDPNNF